MNFSAAWSSSRVLTPGRTLPASRFIVLTRIARGAATAASSGTARSGGQVQIGLFVRHKFSREDGGFACKCNGELVLLFHKQRERGGVAVQEIFFADRADFAVAEKTGQAGQLEMLLH